MHAVEMRFDCIVALLLLLSTYGRKSSTPSENALLLCQILAEQNSVDVTT
jgi:hypothetical protein